MGNTVVHVNNEAYQVLRPLAEGGFASVYEVRRDGQLFALKWTRGVAEDDDLERLQLEIQVQRSLQHRNILSLSAAEVRKCPRHGKAAAEKEALMVSPLATRGSLQTHLERTAARGTAAFTEVECLGFFKRLVEAVSALHALGFAHRDLKPGNILLASCDPVEPLVMDFGSVAPLQMVVREPKDSRRLWEEAARFSSAPYRPPELWDYGSSDEAHGVIDGRTDVWSLGCVLYAMAFGPLSPFEHPRDGVQRLAILNGNVSFPPGNTRFGQAFSPTFTALIKWILTPDVVERPTLKGVGLCINQLLNPRPRKQPSHTTLAVKKSSSRRRAAQPIPSGQKTAADDEVWEDFSAYVQPSSAETESSIPTTVRLSITKPSHAIHSSSQQLSGPQTHFSSRPSAAINTRDPSKQLRTLSQTGKKLWIDALEAQTTA